MSNNAVSRDVKTAVLVSGGGTNLQAILDAHIFGEIKNCELAAVISSNSDAYALTRAAHAGIPSYVIDRKIFPNRASFSEAIHRKLEDLDIDLVVLAGFMYVLDPPLVRAFRNRMINVHPALIPSFSGMGYYGLHVHEAALNYGVKVSGATAHFCTSEADAGPIILQKAVEILETDTPQTLQRRIMEQAEWKILPEAISLFCEGRLEVVDRRVIIKDL
ncbi:MAG: phosphoribosylglycinamide formyltransferase [Oscillospiraceae bacterium]|jgi:phosphoribosylglycinamide formyltransferase-1|nr:phosphoribosylglycinamide formyltransferase [Oscillospiraceae bacterium]